MKTLVIHPQDYTTDFLATIYGHLDATVITTDCSRKVMKTLIKRHDRVIMLGHGDQNGMFGFDKYVINSEMAYALQSKSNSVFIWCNADAFVKRYRLKGFATGMIVSELQEASLFCLPCNLTKIEASNALFAETVMRSIHLPPAEMKMAVKHEYDSDDNEIIQFNSTNIYSF